ncbi:MAG TPA: class I SAM-dependent methyltransferase [Ramlibacter sp.]|jgi:SAM-dependent methyltransferase|uniref:class I SAM-dependent methyltransferase n=1 Tax=Ramlibacter sp. TaxID=1917967 RepID=UPI002D6AE3CC|nr:class I SAM-dependent methyltransferase [Ramlibacter sp.]HZY20684.1 class I SAM-dependent methyltransferase [Ramlibacter sp.]
MHGTEAPSPWIRRWSHLVPAGGSVLDVACGRGRHLRWFAGRGHPVTGVDRDADALASVASAGRTLVADLENGAWPLPGERFAAVVVTNYLWRALFPSLLDSLAPGGALLYETFAEGHETVGKPSRPDFLLRQGELLSLCQGLRIVAYEDGFQPDPDRFVQRIAAVRPLAGNGRARYTL